MTNPIFSVTLPHKSTEMSSKDVKRMIELAEKKLQKGVSQKEALESLQRAGILNKKGDFKAPYKHLAQAIASR